MRFYRNPIYLEGRGVSSDDTEIYKTTLISACNKIPHAYLIFSAQLPQTCCCIAPKHTGEKSRERGGVRRTTSIETSLGIG